MLLAIFLLTAAPIDEVPLIAPIIPQQKVVEGSRLDRSIHLGAKATGLISSGPLLGGSGGGIELGYRLPFLGQRLGLLIDPSFSALFEALFERGATGSSGWLLSMPVGATYHEPVGPGLLRVTALLSFDLASTTSPIAADQSLTLGMHAGLGYVIPAGLGGVVIEVRYRMLSYVYSGANVISHGGTASIGYSFFL